MNLPFKQINFDAGEHKYTDDQGRVYTSVTTLLSEDEPFDAEAIAAKVIINPRSKYYGMDKDAVIKKWADSAPAGTRVHEAVEDWINDKTIPETSDDRYNLVKQFEALNFKGELLSEVILHNEDLLIAGTADIIEDMGDYMYLWDIKTSVARPKGDRVDDTKLHKFSLQLEMYKRLIERNFKKPCKIGGIVWYKNYINLREDTILEVFPVSCVEDEVEQLLIKRRMDLFKNNSLG